MLGISKFTKVPYYQQIGEFKVIFEDENMTGLKSANARFLTTGVMNCSYTGYRQDGASFLADVTYF